MRLLRSARWLLLALLLPLIPASQARAGVFISVGFAPPVLPVYVQPPCPEPGWMWTPGYWAYGDDGYYWVPGAWVPAPYEGALWTPPYWGYEGAVYVFHPGYWGPHVGYYGGINYGFGFFGVGFVGGAWHGREFAYNTAVMHVDRERIHEVYEDRTVIERNTVVRDSRVAYSGGPGGIRHAPTPEERSFMHEQHMAPTEMQRAHVQAARTERSSYFNANHGQPQRTAVERPMGSNGRANAGVHGPQGGFNGNTRVQERQGGFNGDGGARGENRPQPQNGNRANGQQGYGPQPRYRAPEPQRGQPQPQYQPRQESRPQYRAQQQPQYRAPEQQRPQYQPRPESRPQSRPEPRPEARPQSRPEPRPQHEGGPHGQGR